MSVVLNHLRKTLKLNIQVFFVDSFKFTIICLLHLEETPIPIYRMDPIGNMGEKHVYSYQYSDEQHGEVD